MHPKVKLALVVLGKLVVLYLMALTVWIDAIVLKTALPRIMFETDPFLHAVAILMAGALIVALKQKSSTPVIWAGFCLGFSSIYIPSAGFFGYLEFFIAALFLAAGINYLYRNRITEPLLVLLPIISASWLFLQLIYIPYLPVWIARKTGYMSVSEGFAMGFDIHAIWISLLIAPLIVLYLLGKQYYKNIYYYLRRRIQRGTAPGPV